jgi:uncharacterized protein with GYD domain
LIPGRAVEGDRAVRHSVDLGESPMPEDSGRDRLYETSSTDPISNPGASKGEAIMPLYMYQAAYTSESIAAQIKNPQDRIEAVRPAVEALGAKIVTGGYPFGEYDVLIIIEAPDDTTAASSALAVAARGAARAAKTTRLLSGQEWVEALTKAQSSTYQPAR